MNGPGQELENKKDMKMSLAISQKTSAMPIKGVGIESEFPIIEGI